jgi:hypothetical protein
MPAAHLDHASHVGATSYILREAVAHPSDLIIVATEPRIIHQMQLAAPHKIFIGAPGADGNCNCNMCPYMALNTMEKLYVALRDLQPQDRDGRGVAAVGEEEPGRDVGHGGEDRGRRRCRAAGGGPAAGRASGGRGGAVGWRVMGLRHPSECWDLGG